MTSPLSTDLPLLVNMSETRRVPGPSQAKERRDGWTESFCQPEHLLLLVHPLERKVQCDADP